MNVPAAADRPAPPRPTMYVPGRSYAIDREVDAHVDRRPDAYPDPLHNPVTHERVTWFREMLHGVDRALHDEGVDSDVARRVAFRLLYGHPDGPDAIVRLDAEAELHKTLIQSDTTRRLLGGDWSALTELLDADRG